MDEPIIFSIILPLLNGEKYLPSLLESLSIQQCRNFELVVLDAGSTDGGITLIQSFGKTEGIPITISVQPGLGIYESMNRAIEITTTPWIYFTGCDDRLIGKDVTSKWKEEINKTPKRDLIYGNVCLKSSGKLYRGETSLFDLLNKGNICHQAILYHRAIFKVVGGFNTKYPIWADWDLNIRIFQHPMLIHQFFDVTVAEYNDLGGVSAKEDPVFREMLPLCHKADLEKELNSIKKSTSYKIGKFIFGWLDKQ